jgi:cell division septal protein FtsQ
MKSLKRSRRSRFPTARILGRLARWTILCSAIVLILAGVVWIVPRVMNMKLGVEMMGLFQLRAIQIEGVSKDREPDVRAVIEKQQNASLAGLNLEKIREELMQLRWVKEISLRKEWPDALFVKVTERVPFAWVEDRAPADPGGLMSAKPSMGRYRLVDEEGIELESLDYPASGFPVIRWSGVSEIPDPGRTGSSRFLGGELQAGLDVLKALAVSGIGSKNFASLVMEVRDRQDGRCDIRLRYQGLQLRLGTEDLDGQIRRFLSLKPALQAEAHRISEVDLRFPGRLIVRSVKKDKPEKYRAAMEMVARSASSERR